MSPLRLIFFSIIMLLVTGPAHYYLWRRLVKGASLPRPWHGGLTIGFLLLLVSLPLVFILGRSMPREMTAPFAFGAFIWLGLFSTYFVLTGAFDVTAHLLRRVLGMSRSKGMATQKSPASNALPTNPERRRLMGRVFAGSVAATGTAISGVAMANVAGGFRIVELEVTLDKLPSKFDGFRIAQMSDVHVGPTIGGDFVRSIVESTNRLKPDLIAITGDLVDGSVKHLGKHTAPLEGLKSTYGSFFVTGNHEYYSGADDWIEEMARLKIPTLRNDSVRLERDGESLLIAGVTDHRAGEFGDAPDLARALRTRRPNEEVLLLAHQPREISEAKKHDVGLQLSGHTHGGQFWPWNWVVHLVQPVVSGLARFGRTQIYVNSGTGYWGPPMRMGTESEITLITLRAGAAKKPVSV